VVFWILIIKELTEILFDNVKYDKFTITRSEHPPNYWLQGQPAKQPIWVHLKQTRTGYETSTTIQDGNYLLNTKESNARCWRMAFLPKKNCVWHKKVNDFLKGTVKEWKTLAMKVVFICRNFNNLLGHKTNHILSPSKLVNRAWDLVKFCVSGF